MGFKIKGNFRTFLRILNAKRKFYPGYLFSFACGKETTSLHNLPKKKDKKA